MFWLTVIAQISDCVWTTLKNGEVLEWKINEPKLSSDRLWNDKRQADEPELQHSVIVSPAEYLHNRKNVQHAATWHMSFIDRR